MTTSDTPETAELWKELDRRDENLVTRCIHLRAANDRLRAQLAGIVERVDIAIACLDRAQEPILNRPVSVAQEIEYAMRALRSLPAPAEAKDAIAPQPNSCKP